MPPGAHLHAQNSAGLLGYRAGRVQCRPAGVDALRRVRRCPEFQARLRPALTLKTRVALVRELPAGYGVSYGRTFVTPRPMRVGHAGGRVRRRLSAAPVQRGRGSARARPALPVLGRVTMDQMMIDLSALPAVEAGRGGRAARPAGGGGNPRRRTRRERPARSPGKFSPA